MTKQENSATAWRHTPLGRHLRAIEAQVVADALDQAFGFQLVQLGAWGEADEFLPLGKTRRAALLAPDRGPGVSIVADPAALPIASDTVDVVLLPHTLELDPEPHRVLREAERILVGDGHLVILGFNPWSLWGVRRALTWRRFPEGIRRYIPERRMRDWLSLLGMEIRDAGRYCYPLPVDSDAVQERLAGMEKAGARFWPRFGGAYALVARKRVYKVTPLRPAWYRKRHVVGGRLAEPSTRLSA